MLACSPRLSVLEAHFHTSHQSGFQEWAWGPPLPFAWPASMADAASGGLGTSGGKVRATLPLGVIEDDNGICASQRLVEIKGSTKGLLRQAGIPWQMPPITENWLQLWPLPGRAAWLLPNGCQGAFLTAGVRAVPCQAGSGGSENSKGSHLPQLGPRHGWLAQRQAKGTLGMFSGQIGSGAPGKICGKSN